MEWHGGSLNLHHSLFSSAHGGDPLPGRGKTVGKRGSVSPRRRISDIGGNRGEGAIPSGREDSDDQGETKGAFAKLLRRFNVLRRRWRQTKREKRDSSSFRAKATITNSDSERLTSGEVALNTDPRAGRGSFAEELKEEPTVVGRAQDEAGDGPPTNKEDLEMACRRLLDALWMSAKRGTGTLSLSVADGRTLLMSLMAAGGPAEKAGIDLGAPLPRPKTSPSSNKALRPVVGSASGPFARAARQPGSGPSGGSNSSVGSTSQRSRAAGGEDLSAAKSQPSIGDILGGAGSSSQQQKALESAMRLAMGAPSAKDHKDKSGGDNVPNEDEGDTKDPLGEWFRASGPTASRQGRNAQSRANLHGEIRGNSANGRGRFDSANEEGLSGRGSSRHDASNQRPQSERLDRSGGGGGGGSSYAVGAERGSDNGSSKAAGRSASRRPAQDFSLASTSRSVPGRMGRAHHSDTDKPNTGSSVYAVAGSSSMSATARPKPRVTSTPDRHERSRRHHKPPPYGDGNLDGVGVISNMPPRDTRATGNFPGDIYGRERRNSHGSSHRDARRKSAGHHHKGMGGVGQGIVAGAPPLGPGVGGSHYQASVTETTASVLSDESLANLR